jgi:serine/threonine-protein phosphatase 4 regulatory subunit 1
VANELPDWIQRVDICEAVEYILPLLNGLASDGAPLVCFSFSFRAKFRLSS